MSYKLKNNTRPRTLTRPGFRVDIHDQMTAEEMETCKEGFPEEFDRLFTKVKAKAETSKKEKDEGDQ